MKKILFTLFFLIVSISLLSQTTAFKDFQKLSKPKKWWVITHPFKAKKSLLISKVTNRVSDSIRKTKILGTNRSNGKLDAFRHIFWMASLGQEIGASAAKSLGKAHEKENYLEYQERKLEDGITPDKPSMLMDLHNNNVGLSIIEKGKKLTKNQIINKAFEAIKKGKALIVKRDDKNRFVTCDGKIISKINLKKWDNNKCLIKSNAN